MSRPSRKFSLTNVFVWISAVSLGLVFWGVVIPTVWSLFNG